ncbi:hypothetical protein [Nostoc punctiforme]|uniref:hypothetical protein n=1 Tax=Nostoc punctiforme TaxID=272131 RepID=UPI0030ECA125
MLSFSRVLKTRQRSSEVDESSSNTRQMMANRAVDVGITEAFKLRSMGLVQFQVN